MARKKVNDMTPAEPEVKSQKSKIKNKGTKLEITDDKLSAPVAKEDKEVIEPETDASQGGESGERSNPSADARDVAGAPEEPEKKEHKSVKPNIKKHAHGKKYRKIEGIVEKGKEYSLEEAINLIKKTSVSKFDGAVEIHINLNVDPAASDQQVRGSVVLPAGIGREKKVAVVCGAGSEKEAKEAGAETVGGQDLIDKIEKGWLSFDVLVATPDMMGALGKIGKILGTKGLMPNPKSGTVTTDVGKTVKEIKQGKIEYKIDTQGIIHSAIGRVSFDADKLKVNFQALMDSIHNAKPAGVKGTFVKSVFLTSTMGPGIKLIEK